jgi:hypothetical protein
LKLRVALNVDRTDNVAAVESQDIVDANSGDEAILEHEPFLAVIAAEGNVVLITRSRCRRAAVRCLENGSIHENPERDKLNRGILPVQVERQSNLKRDSNRIGDIVPTWRGLVGER